MPKFAFDRAVMCGEQEFVPPDCCGDCMERLEEGCDESGECPTADAVSALAQEKIDASKKMFLFEVATWPQQTAIRSMLRE